MHPEPVSLFIAFSAGFLSFVSPCVLPVVPSYVSYITGLSLKDLSERGKTDTIAIQNSLMFIFGFSSIFIFFGASATAIGHFLLTYQAIIRRVGGLMVIVFGLYLLGLIKPAIFMRDRRFQFQNKPSGLFGSYLVGVAFGAGWTPCVGPILGSILLYAGTTGSVATGMFLLAAYSMGLGIPLFLSSVGMYHFLVSYKEVARWGGVISGISGALLVLFGLLLFTNTMTRITSGLDKAGIGWSIGQ